MKNRKSFISFVFFLFAAFTLNAQQGANKFTINYTAAFPTGSFKNIVSSNSYRGFNANLLHGVSDQVEVGLGIGFQDFYQKNPRQLYKLTDGSDLSAVLTYSIQTIPILATVKYNFKTEGAIQPYAALGAGANFIQYQQLFGEFGERQAKIGFAARPEAGVHVPFRQGGAGFNLGASYSIMPFKQDDLKHLNNIAVHAGISIPIRR
jgi:opacity protein-like surface antigen